MNILIVDDNKHNRYILSAWLKKNGYHVTSTVNGAEALEKLRSQDFDLMISLVFRLMISYNPFLITDYLGGKNVKSQSNTNP